MGEPLDRMTMPGIINEDTNSNSYSEGTVLTDVLGNHGKVKILAALLSEPQHDLNISDIARMAGVDRGTVYEHIDELRAYGVVEQTRTAGNSKMFQINTDSPAAKAIGKLEYELLNELAEKEERGEIDKETGKPILQ